jgi:hypothetical protein
MKGVFLATLFIGTFSTCVVAETKLQRGTIVRMQMAECISAERGFMAALSGASHPSTEEFCPEYVLVADKVVYVIVGRTSSSLVPLAETTKFRFQNNELLIRIDDARHETRFGIREMVLRSEWDRAHPRTMDGMEDQSPHRVDAAVVMQQPQ